MLGKCVRLFLEDTVSVFFDLIFDESPCLKHLTANSVT